MSFNIVSGLRRNGTSLMMLCLREAGIPIIGFKYPVEFNHEGVISCIPSLEARRANPTGYWEAGNITTETGLSQNYSDIGNDGDCIKIVADPLCKSAPTMVGKVIVMIRRPRNFLKSMSSADMFKIEELGLVAMTKVQFIIDLFRYLKRYEKEYIVVKYEDLIKEPIETMQGVCKFIGRGHFTKYNNPVKPELNRSKEMPGDLKGIELLENIYEWATTNQIDKILKLDK